MINIFPTLVVKALPLWQLKINMKETIDEPHKTSDWNFTIVEWDYNMRLLRMKNSVKILIGAIYSIGKTMG